jgi:hypothetical protein
MLTPDEKFGLSGSGMPEESELPTRPTFDLDPPERTGPCIFHDCFPEPAGVPLRSFLKDLLRGIAKTSWAADAVPLVQGLIDHEVSEEVTLAPDINDDDSLVLIGKIETPIEKDHEYAAAMETYEKAKAEYFLLLKEWALERRKVAEERWKIWLHESDVRNSDDYRAYKEEYGRWVEAKRAERGKAAEQEAEAFLIKITSGEPLTPWEENRKRSLIKSLAYK